MYYRAHMRELL